MTTNPNPNEPEIAMSLTDDSNDGTMDFSLLDMDTPVRRLCTVERCDNWQDAGSQFCARHARHTARGAAPSPTPTAPPVAAPAPSTEQRATSDRVVTHDPDAERIEREQILARLRALPRPTGVRRDVDPSLPLPTLRDLLRRRERAAARAANPAPASPASPASDPAPAGFEGVALSSAAAETTSGLVRGFVRPEDVNPVAGYNVPVTASRGQATRYAGAAIPTDTNAIAPAPEVRRIERSDLVAGAKSEGSGVLVGWGGLGEMTRGRLVAALIEAGLSGVVLPPDAKSAHAQAGHALATLTSRGYVVRAVRKGRGASGARRENQQFRARWTVGAVGHTGGVGDAFGTTLLVATLTTHGGTLILEGREELRAEVQAEFERRIAAETYTATEISQWLKDVMRANFRAVAVGGMFYVPKRHASNAERLCEMMAALHWGRDWMLPALPVSTSDQLKAGLARGIIDEARDVLDQLEAQRKVARDAGRADVGERAAVSLIGKLRAVAERALMYGAILGTEQLARVRAAVVGAIADIEPLCGDVAMRGALIWDELQSDIDRRSGRR